MFAGLPPLAALAERHAAALAAGDDENGFVPQTEAAPPEPTWAAAG
jgi:hypothetical protein